MFKQDYGHKEIPGYTSWWNILYATIIFKMVLFYLIINEYPIFCPGFINFLGIIYFGFQKLSYFRAEYGLFNILYKPLIGAYSARFS